MTRMVLFGFSRNDKHIHKSMQQTALARSLGLEDVRVGRAAFTNKALRQRLLDRGFEIGSIPAPPPFEGDMIEFVSTVFSVR